MRVQVTIPLDSNVPEDSIVNTWYMDGDDDPFATFANYAEVAREKLRDFYQAIDSVIFPSTVGDTATVKVYDMRDPEPRQAKYLSSITLTNSSSGPFPGEVALCNSFAVTVASGANAARRRVRIFLGPIAESAGVVIASQNRPSLAARAAVRDAAAALAVATPLGPGFGPGSISWAIYSPTTDQASTIDDSFFDVQRGWVDDAWDTQRRRGAAPTARVVFP